MRRFQQQANDEECLRLLGSAKRGVLAALGDNEYPYTVPLDYVYGDGNIYFHCAGEGHKLDAVRKHDKELLINNLNILHRLARDSHLPKASP